MATGPVVGFLSEYDALPGLGKGGRSGQQEPRADGNTNGHGCGHNLLGASLTGAAIAAAGMLEANDLPGAVRVYGCAAEETEGAKVYMVRDGLFGDVDACLHWHPWSFAAVMNMRLAAVNTVRIAFRGKTAHAGMEPWSGRSALDGLELTAHALNLMREHVEPTARLHYIYEEAGEAPNIVPDYAGMLLFIRDIDRVHVTATTEWVRQIAEGAALATQTTSEVDVFFGMHDLLPNAPLAERMQQHLADVGAPTWTEEEQAFGRACQTNMELPARPLERCDSVAARDRDRRLVGRCGRELERSDHGRRHADGAARREHAHVAVTACGGMSIGLKAALAAAQVLTLTAVDVLTDDDLRQPHGPTSTGARRFRVRLADPGGPGRPARVPATCLLP